MARLPTRQPQSEWLLGQNRVFRLTGVWNSFTSHLFSAFILNQRPIQLWWEDSWHVAACSTFSTELCTPAGNIGSRRREVSGIRCVCCVLLGIEMNNATNNAVPLPAKGANVKLTYKLICSGKMPNNDAYVRLTARGRCGRFGSTTRLIWRGSSPYASRFCWFLLSSWNG